MNYELIERRLSTSLAMLPKKFPARDREICEEYIKAGEYGVAFEHFCVQLVELKLPVSAECFEEIKWLGVYMEIDESYVSDLAVEG